MRTLTIAIVFKYLSAHAPVVLSYNYHISFFKVNFHYGFNNWIEDLGLFRELTGEIQKEFNTSIHLEFLFMCF